MAANHSFTDSIARHPQPGEYFAIRNGDDTWLIYRLREQVSSSEWTVEAAGKLDPCGELVPVVGRPTVFNNIVLHREWWRVPNLQVSDDPNGR